LRPVGSETPGVFSLNGDYRAYHEDDMAEHVEETCPLRLGRLGPTLSARRHHGVVISGSARLYLAVVLDLFSRFVVGWAVSAVSDRHLARRRAENGNDKQFSLTRDGMRKRTVVGPGHLVANEYGIPLKREGGAGAAVRAGTATALGNAENSILNRTSRDQDHNRAGEARAARVNRTLVVESAGRRERVRVLATCCG
jgi:hypothetical protein